MIDFDKSRIIVVNTVHDNYDYQKLVLNPMRTGKIQVNEGKAKANTNMSGWSNKTVCRQLTAKPDNAEYIVETQQRGLSCGNGAKVL